MDGGTDPAPPGDAGASGDGEADASGDATEGGYDTGWIVPDGGPPNPLGPRGVAAGGTFACAALADGTARCWGDDTTAQLGDGRRVIDPQGPVMVIATPGAAAN